MNKTWTDEERQVIRNFAHLVNDEQLAEKVSEVRGKPVSLQAVRKQRQLMGIKKARGRGVCQVVTGYNQLDDRV